MFKENGKFVAGDRTTVLDRVARIDCLEIYGLPYIFLPKNMKRHKQLESWIR